MSSLILPSHYFKEGVSPVLSKLPLFTCPPYSFPSQEIQLFSMLGKVFTTPEPSLSASSSSAAVHEMSMLLILQMHHSIPDLAHINSFTESLYPLHHNLTEMTLFTMTIPPSSHFGEIFLFSTGSLFPCSCLRLWTCSKEEKRKRASTFLDHLPSLPTFTPLWRVRQVSP